MLKVYVAGPYSADNVIDVLKNIGKGRQACADLFALGFAPFCPWHDADFIIMNPDINHPVQYFRDYCIEWLKVSDVMLLLDGWQKSVGCQEEFKLANKLNIPIFYTKFSLLKYNNNLKKD